jgi:hypothetical protein
MIHEAPSAVPRLRRPERVGRVTGADSADDPYPDDK